MLMYLAVACAPPGRAPAEVTLTGTQTISSPSPAEIDTADTGTSGPTPVAEPGVRGLRRLSRAEYVHALGALLGTTVPAGELPADPTVDGFDNDTSLLGVTPVHVQAWQRIAEREAAALMAHDTRRLDLVGCLPLGPERASCLEAFARRLGRRAFRRPLTDDEAAALVALGMAVEQGWDGPQLIVEALLQSPSFLFRTELGLEGAEPRELTAFELASKLAFLVWAGPPDDALLDAAQAGALDTPEGLQAELARMLGDVDHTYWGIRSFVERWTRIEGLYALPRDPSRFPEWSFDLALSMEEETTGFLYEHAVADVPFLDALVSPYTWIDRRLAPLYGTLAPPPGQWVRVDFDPGEPRGGVLSQPGILALTAPTEDVAPILRGKWVSDVWICNAPGAPPDTVPALPPDDGASTLRERLAAHTDNPACAGCHDRLDPVGFGLERYDMLGRYRTEDHAGNPLTGQGELSSPVVATFTGPTELGEVLRSSPEVARCVTSHVVRWAAGRPLDEELDLVVDEIVAEHGAGFRFLDLMTDLVLHPSFRKTPPRVGQGECP